MDKAKIMEQLKAVDMRLAAISVSGDGVMLMSEARRGLKVIADEIMAEAEKEGGGNG